MQTLTLVRVDRQAEYIAQEFACAFTVTCAGDGLWGCEAGRQVNVNGITVVTTCYDDELYVQVNVAHDSEWDIYTDTAFEEAISDALGFDVSFTEQGMQEDFFASMEA